MATRYSQKILQTPTEATKSSLGVRSGPAPGEIRISQTWPSYCSATKKIQYLSRLTMEKFLNSNRHILLTLNRNGSQSEDDITWNVTDQVTVFPTKLQNKRPCVNRRVLWVQLSNFWQCFTYYDMMEKQEWQMIRNKQNVPIQYYTVSERPRPPMTRKGGKDVTAWRSKTQKQLKDNPLQQFCESGATK